MSPARKRSTTAAGPEPPVAESAAPEPTAAAESEATAAKPARRRSKAAKEVAESPAEAPQAVGALDPLIDPQTLRSLHGSYATANADGLRDPEWLRQARWRRRQLGESMRAFD
ncbi:MAG: hypothetical protein ACKOYK_10775, partial [Cyanobium sp.]